MASVFGPGQKLFEFNDEFLKELEDDFQSPGSSKFQNYMNNCRIGMQKMEESLSVDKSHIHKMTGSLKELFRTGDAHGNSLKTCADDLIKFGTTVSTAEPLLGNSFVKFGTLLNQMSSLLTNLNSSSRNILLFSLNLVYENELRGSRYKSDLKALFAQYQSAKNTVEKDERKILVQAGVNVTDRVFTAEELAGKLITDRRKFQMGVVEYMMKYHDVKTKGGLDFAEHLVAYYRAKESYFKDGNTLLQALKIWESKLSKDITELRAKQDEERKRLIAARDRIRNDMGIMVGKSHGPAQVDPNQCTDTTEKTGYLGKRPDNALRLPRRQWPKKYCTVSMNGFTLANSHNHAPNVKIPVLHFQCKDCPEPIDGRKYCFKLFAQTRTYTFDAESEKELAEWKQAMLNCQLKLFQGETEGTLSRKKSNYSSHTIRSNTRDLVKRIIFKIRSLPGNDKCADCGAPDPEWLSVNLGILICINCSGRHRELSVQYSRIRSLKLDQLKTTELLIALVMGNGVLNEVLEANVTDPKPTPDSSLEYRGEYISSKYLQKKYIERSVEKDDLLHELAEAVESNDIKQLLQVYAEGVDLCAPLPGYSAEITAIHLAVELEDLTSLHMVDFILGNGRTENVPNAEGNTPLHLAVINDNPQCVKLLLIHGTDLHIKNNEGNTPLMIAEEKNFDDCIELLTDALKKKFTKCDHIDVDWGVGDGGEGEEEIYQTPVIDALPTSVVPAPSSSGHGGEGMLKKSETVGSFLDEHSKDVSPLRPSTSLASGIGNGNARRRPVSTYQLEPRSPRASPAPQPYPIPADKKGPVPKSPYHPSQPNVYPAPSQPAPPPPPRTVSKNADPVPSVPGGHGNVPVPPTRRKKIMSMFPEQMDRGLAQDHHPNLVVEALYDCDPDHEDELGFKEGDKIIVTKKLNKDWWRGYLISDASRRQRVFPVNYVTDTPPTISRDI